MMSLKGLTDLVLEDNCMEVCPRGHGGGFCFLFPRLSPQTPWMIVTECNAASPLAARRPLELHAIDARHTQELPQRIGKLTTMRNLLMSVGACVVFGGLLW